MMKSESLPVPARESIGVLASMLTDSFKDNLMSLTLVGSVLSEDFCSKHSDINSVLVVQENVPGVLESLAKVEPSLKCRRLAAPLLMRPDYIEQSCDVFAVEWLDYQWRHHTVVGTDPFSSLAFTKGDVRLQCEREFKSAMVRLRQGYIESAGKPAVVGQLIAAAGRELLPYLRAMLWLHDTERPEASAATFEQAGGIIGASLAGMSDCYIKRHQRSPLTAATATTVFLQTYGAVEQLAGHVGGLEGGK